MRAWRSGVIAIVILAGAFWAVAGRTLSVPDWLVSRIETRINTALAAQAHVQIGALDLEVSFGRAPQVRLREVSLFAPGLEGRRWWGAVAEAGTPPAPLLFLPDVRASLSATALLSRQMQPEDLHLEGGTITIKRLTDGRFDLAFGGGFGASGTLAEVLDALDDALANPVVAGLEEIRAEGLNVIVNDERAERDWQSSGRLRVVRNPGAIEALLSLDAISGASHGGLADLQVVAETGTAEASVQIAFAGIDAADIAAQTPALEWLALLQTRVGGAASVEIDAAGALRAIRGSLSLDPGVLQPTEAMTPVAFDGASLEFTVDPVSGQVTVSDLSIDSELLQVSAQGTARLSGDAEAPLALLGQFRIDTLALDPAGQFEVPATVDGGTIDLRLSTDPFRIEFGQINAQKDDAHVVARGVFSADDQGWRADFDATSADLEGTQVLQLWPAALARGTRAWLSEHLIESRLSNVAFALRARSGARPDVALSFDYADTSLRPLRTLPPVTGARGHASIQDHAFTLSIDAGVVDAPNGGAVDVSGTVYRVADTRQRPATGGLSLRTDSSLTAALSLLDQPPFEFLSKTGLGVELGEARVRLQAEVSNPLMRPVPPEAVEISATGRMIGASSSVLVPGRRLVAPELQLSLVDDRLEIAGAGTLDGVPFQMSWSRGIRAADDGRSQLVGTAILSDSAARTFGVSLPDGAISGQATADLAVESRRGERPDFTLRSELVGLGLGLDTLGWSKPAAASGELLVRGRLGREPEVDQLLLKAAGLHAEGSVKLAAAGGLDRARLKTVRIGGWLDAVVEVTGRGPDVPPSIAVLGGSADLRRRNPGAGRHQGSAAATSGDLTVALDSLVISDGIALTGFEGRFTNRGGLSGSFRAGVNGGAPVTGVIAPDAGGRSAFRLRSDDAGAVFRSAGVFGKAHGGVMDMVLSPRGGAGEYDGRLQVQDTRVRQAPVLADLLGAISVIGLLEQLDGQGLVFSNVDADFRLTTQTIEVISASATGNSLGISLAGVYGLASKRMEMQGVISPVYMLNAIGGIFSPRRGEGLIGVNYSLSGEASRPQVQVNPLSVLAPGALREIFRRAPPSVTR